jgi:hypothetical protein
MSVSLMPLKPGVRDQPTAHTSPVATAAARTRKLTAFGPFGLGTVDHVRPSPVLDERVAVVQADRVGADGPDVGRRDDRESSEPGVAVFDRRRRDVLPLGSAAAGSGEGRPVRRGGVKERDG